MNTPINYELVERKIDQQVRAARLLDLMEAAGLIGPGDGAKPRDVDLEKIEERLS